MEISVPRPQMNDVNKENFAIEVAFNALVDAAQKEGIGLVPVMGLMYLPDQAVRQQFQDSCRAVLRCLKMGVS